MDQNEITEATAAEAELVLLRGVYEAARSFLRFNGVDLQRMHRAVGEMDLAIERVKLLDGGLLDFEDLHRLLQGSGTISQIYQICQAYESGFGHGLQLDGLDNAENDTFPDPRHNEAYKIGYRRGARIADKFGPETAQRAFQAQQAAQQAEDAAKVKRVPEHEAAQIDQTLGLRSLPPVRLPLTEFDRLSTIGSAHGVVVQALARQLLANASDEQIIAAAKQVKLAGLAAAAPANSGGGNVANAA